jgi:glycosyltransferase involved in cell wall biosynthesis
MTISVVIPTCRNESSLQKCVSSVVDQKGFTDYEIIVVDCVHNEKTQKFCSQVKPPGTYTVQEGEGLNNARNKGLTLSKGDIILLLDDDTRLPQSFLCDVATVFRDNPHIDCSGFLDLPLPENPYSNKCSRYVENFSRKYLVRGQFAKIKGAAMAMRKTDLTFDPQRKYYDADDTEFVYRLARSGAKLAYFTYPYVFHNAPSLLSVVKMSTTVKAVQNLAVPGLLHFHNVIQVLVVVLACVFFIVSDARLFLAALGGLFIFSLSLLISFTETQSGYYTCGIVVHILLSFVYQPLILLVYTVVKVRSILKTGT